MELQTYSLRVDKEDLKIAKKVCKKKLTTLQVQLREFIKRIGQDESNLLKGGITNGID